MVFDRLENASLYESLHPRFARAFSFLRDNVAALPAGRHDIDGDALYALVAVAPGRGRTGAKLESHRRYIDIQYVVRGTDDIGLKPASACTNIELEYQAAQDVALYLDPPANWLAVPAGSFAIFFPDDGHAPLGSAEETTKVVVKVAIDD